MPTTNIRKFAVREVPPAEFLQKLTIIHQGYLAVGADGDEVRLRQSRDSYTGIESHTQAVRARGRVASTELTVDQFNDLWPATKGRQLLMNRHTSVQEGLVYKIDSYVGQLAGLTVVGVEFVDVVSEGSFESPTWAGDELTGLPLFENQRLAALDCAPTGSRISKAGRQILVPYLDLTAELLR